MYLILNCNRRLRSKLVIAIRMFTSKVTKAIMASIVQPEELILGLPEGS